MSDPFTTASRQSTPLVIVSTAGTGGDIQPFITLALGLRERGHRVLMVVPGLHKQRVMAAGLPCEAFGRDEEFQQALSNPDLWDERKGWGVIWRCLLPHLGVLRTLIQRLPAHAPCVMLCHPFLIPMAALARSVRPDLHVVAAYLAPANLCSSHDFLTAGSQRIPSWLPLSWRQTLWRLIDRWWIDPVTLPGLNAARATCQLPAVSHFFDHMLQSPNASVGLFPSWFAAVQPDWPHPFSNSEFPCARIQSAEGAALSPELARFLSEGDAPIIFTPGTGHQHAARYFATALETLKRLGRRGVLVTPYGAQVSTSLPPSVLWQAHAPFAALLPRAAAIVHHGGVGTLAEAFSAGIPQLVVPFAYDQFDNGLRAKRWGVADVLLAKHLSVRRMTRQLGRLLASQAVHQACGVVAGMMAQSSARPCMVDRVEAALGIAIGPEGIVKA